MVQTEQAKLKKLADKFDKPKPKTKWEKRWAVEDIKLAKELGIKPEDIR